LVEALSNAQAAVAHAQQQWGPEHPLTLRCIHDLARVYLRLGYPDQAEALLEQVLQIASHVPGYPVYDTILVAGNLAYVHQSQKRFTEAEPLYLLALSLLEEQPSISLRQQVDLSQHLLHYVDMLGTTGRTDEQLAVRMKIELLLREAQQRQATAMDREQAPPSYRAGLEQAMEDAILRATVLTVRPHRGLSAAHASALHEQ
jgi:tetratricopeptide (TPR) repeat protein